MLDKEADWRDNAPTRMAGPKNQLALRFHRVATQRWDEANQIFQRLRLSAVAVYLAGYSVECILKALILEKMPIGASSDPEKELIEEFGHDLNELQEAIRKQWQGIPLRVLEKLVYVSTWSPAMRYQPGPGDAYEAQEFLKAARIVIKWADERMK